MKVDSITDAEPAATPMSNIARERIFRVRRDGSSVEIDAGGPPRHAAAEDTNSLFLGADNHDTLETLTRAIKSGESQSVTFRQDANGEVRDYRAMLVPGIPGEVVALVHDISSQRDLEERLLHTQKLASLGQLTGGIAHDFSNILTAIMGYCQEASYEAGAVGSAGSSVAGIQRAAESGAELCRRLLGSSPRETAKDDEVDLNELVADIAPLLDSILAENIELVTQLGPDLGHVKIDRDHIEHVIVNLAINGRDALPRGGTITVATSRVAFDRDSVGGNQGVPAGDYVVLSVADTRPGVPEVVGPRIVEPLSTTDQPNKGVGVGLFMCLKIVEKNGGKMLVHSQHGIGTTFEIYLPSIESPVTMARPLDSPGGRETVLLVEDERMVREVSAHVLRQHGYTVLEAADGREAVGLALAQEERAIDLLFTDVVMPDMTGWDLADCLRPLVPGIRVLYTSGYSQADIGQSSNNVPPFAFIEKPFNPEQLARRIRDVLAD